MVQYIETDAEFDDAFEQAYAAAKRESEKAHIQTAGRMLALFVASNRKDEDDATPPQWGEVVQSLATDGGLAFVGYKVASSWNSQGSVDAGKQKVLRFLRPWPNLYEKVDATNWPYPE